jgi:hypothetical protein
VPKCKSDMNIDLYFEFCNFSFCTIN